MYEALLQSSDRPFRATPDSKFYFPIDSVEQARQTVVRAILRAEGPCLILGGAGLGKSMLGQVIAEDVYGRFDIVKLHASGLCSRRALLQSILFELQLPYRGLSEGELRMSIMDRLSPSPETAPGGILLIVDEAHTLSPKLLEELRLITNFARNGQPRARLVLIGNMRLEDTFAHPQMDSFNQRLAARCYLQPMTREQTMEFVRHQLRCVQIEPASIITSDALRTLFSASEGIPRLVNQVMDHALVLGITTGQCPVSAALIEEAWSDLQQLPAPWHSGPTAEKAQTSGSIEFGELRDEDEDAFERSSSNANHANTSIAEQTISIDTRPFEYSAIEELTSDSFSSYGSEDYYQLASEYNTPDQLVSDDSEEAQPATSNFFAAFVANPTSIESNDAQPAATEYSGYTLTPEDEMVAELLAPQKSQGIQQSKATQAAFQPIQPESKKSEANERVVFDASKAFGFQRTQDASSARGDERIETAGRANTQLGNSAIGKASINGFFASQTSDADILNIDDEEPISPPSIDNVWENDPPIRNTVSNNRNEVASQTIDSRHLFGDDFEEEISISGRGSSVRERRIFEPKPLQAASELPLSARQAAIEEQLAAMEQQRIDADDERPYEDAEQAKRYASSNIDANNMLASWTVDVAATEAEREIALHSEIEDLVSQLNFSAFAVEPFSVEQIAIEYPTGAAPAKRELDASSEASERETIYRLHTTNSAAMDEDIHSNLTLDDDRDLLVIEEELPVSNRMTAEQPASTAKTTNYSQLFAKLRH